MNRLRALSGLLLLMFLGPEPVSAQDPTRGADIVFQPADTLAGQNSIGTVFDRNLSTFNWLGRLLLDTTIVGTRVRLDNRFSSNVIESDFGQAGSRKYATDQNILRMLLKQPVAEGLQAVAGWYSLSYSDQRGVGLSNASNQLVRGGIEWMPVRFLACTPLAGYRWDTQGTIADDGPSLGLGFQTNGLEADGYRITGGGDFQRDFLDPRLLASDGVRVGVQKFFSANTRDSLEAGYVYLRREFYGPADSTLESRLDRYLVVGNLLEYEAAPRLLTSLFVAVRSRGLDKDLRGIYGQPPPAARFDTRIDEFHLETFFQSAYRWGDGGGETSLRIGYAERDETHSAKPRHAGSGSQNPAFIDANRREQSKDNVTRRTTLSGLVRVPLTGSDRLFLSGAASILRYDTPSTLNVEDRDELLVAASAGTRHSVSPVLDLGIGLDGSYNHAVYLLKERSANNNINRVLRLAPWSLYRPAAYFSSMNALEVLANYTVYDYEREASQVRSYSYRQFSWIDSTTLQFSPRVALDLFAYVKLSERGQLNWDEFSERPENSYADQTYSGQMRFTPFTGTVFAVGLRYFSQMRYSYEQGVKTVIGRIRSIGPTCMIVWDAGRIGQVNLRGWYERRTQLDETSVHLVTINFAVVYNF